MATKHYTIPIFIPMKACPFHCIFCDQVRITGRNATPSLSEVKKIILRNLSTIPKKNVHVEIGFFGGTFTGLPPQVQKDYLEVALPFAESHQVSGIRLSTRPDFISPDTLSLLSGYPVKTIELGAQSMDDEVLGRSGRGHTAADTEKSSRMIIENGFSLGLQMMIGLPGDTDEKSVETASKIIALGASETRIYPVIVIKGTRLQELCTEGKFRPLELDEAVDRTRKVADVFNSSEVRIIRIGLHPSEGLLSREDYVAGPFHTSFRELVMTAGWRLRFEKLLTGNAGGKAVIYVNPSDINAAIGYSRKNLNMLEEHFSSVGIKADAAVECNSYHVDIG